MVQGVKIKISFCISKMYEFISLSFYRCHFCCGKYSAPSRFVTYHGLDYLPPVSTTLAKLVAKFAAGVVDIGGKFAASVVDTGGNFAAGVFDTGCAP
jgi:hypothetical protein